MNGWRGCRNLCTANESGICGATTARYKPDDVTEKTVKKLVLRYVITTEKSNECTPAVHEKSITIIPLSAKTIKFKDVLKMLKGLQMDTANYRNSFAV